MTRQLKDLNQYFFQHKRNGYSILEILLIFGIIVGLLVGAWTMYAVFVEEARAQQAITEIQMIKQAANEFKRESGGTTQNLYTNAGTNLDALMPYLGQGRLEDSRNVFGGKISISARNTNKDLRIRYLGVLNLDVCWQILDSFGDVQRNVVGTDIELNIPSGDALPGYLGGTSYNTGCKPVSDGTYDLRVLID